MKTTALAGVLSAALAATCAWAGTPAQEAVRRQATALQSQVPALRLSEDAPQLSGQLTELLGGVQALVHDKTVTAEAARLTQDAASSLNDQIARAPKPLGNEFCRTAASKVQAIAARALGLLQDAAAGVVPGAYKPDFSFTGFAPPDPVALAALQKRAAAMAAVMDRTNFDGAALRSITPLAPTALPARATLPRRRPDALMQLDAAERVAADQHALDSFLTSIHRQRITTDGISGPATRSAVALFQKKHGLPVTGVVNAATESALMSDFQARLKLPVTGAMNDATAEALEKEGIRYFPGNPADFDASAKASRITGVLTTVYTPFIAKSKKARRMEGAPEDRFMQTVCTLERYLNGVCPYVSVAIDRRLNVPNGTPVLIPGISDLVGRTVRFRIVDTGSLERFNGPQHVDIATDSNQHSGWGKAISGGHFTLVLPQGLHPRLTRLTPQ